MSRIAIFVLIYGLIFGYPWMRLIASVVPGFVWHPVPLAILLCLPAVMWIASRKVAPPARYAIARVAYCWLGSSFQAGIETIRRILSLGTSCFH